MNAERRFVITYENGDFVKVHLQESEVAEDITEMLGMGFKLVSVEPDEEN